MPVITGLSLTCSIIVKTKDIEGIQTKLFFKEKEYGSSIKLTKID